MNLYFWSLFKFKNSDVPQTFDSSDTGPLHILCFSAENELEQELKRLNIYRWSTCKFRSSAIPQIFFSLDTEYLDTLCFSAQTELAQKPLQKMIFDFFAFFKCRNLFIFFPEPRPPPCDQKHWGSREGILQLWPF